MLRAVARWLIVCAALTVVSAHGVSASSAKTHPTDEHTRQEFDWTLYLDVRDVPNYLEYRGSQMHPLTRVRVYLKQGARAHAADATPQPYEDFWYYKGKVIGVRRRIELNFDQRTLGSLVVGSCADDQNSRRAASDAVVRLFVALLLKQTPPNVVMVPESEFDGFAADLGHYHFSPEMLPVDGLQTSIRMQAYPGDREEVYYYQR